MIVLETPRVLVVDKPAGVVTIPERFGSPEPSLHARLQAERSEKLWVVHRLDRPVSGVLLFARDAEAHSLLNRAFEQRRVHKTYEAWTEGEQPPDGEVVWTDLLLRGKKRAYVSPVGKHAETAATPMGPAPSGWAWRLAPKTGRPHQLRVQLAMRGWPIVGDELYGAKTSYDDGAIALRAVALALPPEDAEQLGLPPRIEVPGLAQSSPKNT